MTNTTRSARGFAAELIEHIIEIEGGFVDDPRDPGGATRWGITEAVARRAGYTGPMRDLPKDFARGVYLERYYTDPGFDRVAALSEPVAAEMTDTGVNCGVAVAKTMLQRALNAFNRNGRDYPDIAVDGAIGPMTLDALERFLLFRRNAGGEAQMVKALNGLQCARYFEIVERRPGQEHHFFGWLANRVA